MIKCICIDDSNRPTSIPPEKWIEKGKEYHIISARIVKPQKQMAVQLLEINLDESCAPFTYFLGKRFMIKEDVLKDLLMLISATINHDNEIKELISIQNEHIYWN